MLDIKMNKRNKNNNKNKKLNFWYRIYKYIKNVLIT